MRWSVHICIAVYNAVITSTLCTRACMRHHQVDGRCNVCLLPGWQATWTLSHWWARARAFVPWVPSICTTQPGSTHSARRLTLKTKSICTSDGPRKGLSGAATISSSLFNTSQ